MHSRIAAASKKGERAVPWLKRCEEDITTDDLSSSGRGFRALDLDLATALNDIILDNNPFRGRIDILERQANQKGKVRG